MVETTQNIFLKIARRKMFLQKSDVEILLGLQAIDRMRGERRRIQDLCIEEELLTEEQVRGILRGVRYYVVRQADRRYGRILLERRLVARRDLNVALMEQKRTYQRKKTLLRLSKILLDKKEITIDEDRNVRRELLEGEPLSPSRSRHDGAAFESARWRKRDAERQRPVLFRHNRPGRKRRPLLWG